MNAAAASKAQSDQVAQALAVTRELPDQPGDCKRTARSGIVVGDRLDTALVKMDYALTRANNRTARCSQWYETLKGAYDE